MFKLKLFYVIISLNSTSSESNSNNNTQVSKQKKISYQKKLTTLVAFATHKKQP